MCCVFRNCDCDKVPKFLCTCILRIVEIPRLQCFRVAIQVRLSKATRAEFLSVVEPWDRAGRSRWLIGNWPLLGPFSPRGMHELGYTRDSRAILQRQVRLHLKCNVSLTVILPPAYITYNDPYVYSTVLIQEINFWDEIFTIHILRRKW